MKAVRLENFKTKTPPGKSAEKWRRKKKNLTGTGWSSAPAESGETGGKDTGTAGTPPERRPTYSETMQGYYGDRYADALAENKTAADAAADERVDGIRLQKSRQRAVAVSHRVHNSRRDDPPVGQIVKLELCGTAKMPVNFAMVKRNCKPHETASCSAHAVQYDDIV